MGVTDTEGNTGKKAPGNSRAVPTSVPPWLSVEHMGMGHGVNLGDADPATLKAAIAAVTGYGAAFSLSESRDHRSVTITILDGGDRPKFFAATPAELSSLLERLADAP